VQTRAAQLAAAKIPTVMPLCVSNRGMVMFRLLVLIALIVATCAAAYGEPLGEAMRYQLAQAPAPAADRIDPTEEDAERALERLLVTRGISVLPLRAMEVEPEIRYRFEGTAAQGTRRDTVSAALGFRVGLPFDSQAQLRIPYVIHDETEFDTTSGIGDVQLSLTKQVLRERKSIPSLLFTARWTAPTGDDTLNPSALGTGSGFHIVEGLVTSSIQRDPLVFYGTASYATVLPEKRLGVDVSPGDIFTLEIGAILAASPDTTLHAAVNMGFAGTAEVAGRPVRGSDRVLGILELGVAHVIARRALISVTAEIGITEDAPDLRLVVSMPFRF
jgi:hypothetical protein